MKSVEERVECLERELEVFRKCLLTVEPIVKEYYKNKDSEVLVSYV